MIWCAMIAFLIWLFCLSPRRKLLQGLVSILAVVLPGCQLSDGNVLA